MPDFIDRRLVNGLRQFMITDKFFIDCCLCRNMYILNDLKAIIRAQMVK